MKWGLKNDQHSEDQQSRRANEDTFSAKNMSSFRRHGDSEKKSFGALVLGSLVLFSGALLVSLAVIAAVKGSGQKTAVPEKIKVVEVIKTEAPEMVSVLVPVQEIAQGVRLEPSMFRVEKKPRASIPASAIKSFEDLKDQFARSIIAPEQPLAKELITTVRPPNPVIASIPAGYRAVSINVNQTTAVEGWATAGASVDVMWVTDALGERSVVNIVQNAKVLSAERQTENSTEPGQPIPTAVTLLVSEKEAPKIGLAQTSGQLMLVLRGASEVGKGQASGALTLRSLIGNAGKADTGDIDGVVRIKRADGTYEELALVGKKLVKR